MPPPLASHAERLSELRAAVRAIEQAGCAAPEAVLPFGIDAIDARLAGGGLARTALHEATGATPDLGDDAAATLFLAGVAARCEGPVLWAIARRDLFAPGLAQAGLGPGRILYAEAGGDADVLAVMEEGLRHGGLGAVVGEVRRAATAATRRLQLAAEEGGVTALLLRRPSARDADPLGEPSAAATRWRIGAAPSVPLPVANGVGRGCWRLDLVRQRRGEPFALIVEAADAAGRLALLADAGDRSVAAERRAGGAERRAA